MGDGVHVLDIRHAKIQPGGQLFHLRPGKTEIAFDGGMDALGLALLQKFCGKIALHENFSSG